MSNKLQIDVEANVGKAKKDLLSLETDVKKLQKTAEKGAKINLKKGISPTPTSNGGFSVGGVKIDKLGDLGKLTDIKGLLGGVADKVAGIGLGGLGGVAAGAAAGIGAGAAAAGAWYSHVKGLVEQGKEAQTNYERLNATLGQIGNNVAGVKDVSSTVKYLQEMGAKGKTPLDQLEQVASRLMVAFRGNQTEVKKWTQIVADMSAGCGESVTMLTEVITKAKQFDTVEFSVFTQLNEKGIPIIEKLAEHLGITTDKAKELAQAGKVTGDNFMAAYEMAHKMTYQGANLQGGSDTLAGAEKTIEQYKALQAAAVTEGYNAAKLGYAKERAALEEQRYRDPHIRLGNEASGQLAGQVDLVWQKFTDAVVDFTNWAGRLVGSGITEELSQKESSAASIGTKGFTALGIDGIIKRADGSWENSAVIDGYLQSMREQLEQERAKITNSSFSDETRQKAQQAARDLSAAIRICEDALRAVKAHEAELAEMERKQKIEAEGQRVKNAYNLSTAATAEDTARAMGYANLDGLKDEYNKIKDRIGKGQGNQADLEKITELQKVIDAATKEIEQSNKIAQGKKEYDLSAAAAAGSENAKVQLQMQQEATKLKSLGFTTDEVESRLNQMRDRLLKEAQEKQSEVQQQYDDKMTDAFYQGSENSASGYRKWERNAWGAAGASYQHFTNPIDEKQLGQLEKANNQLRALIEATKEIDVKTLAQ